VNTQQYQLTSFVRFNEGAYSSDGYASEGFASYAPPAPVTAQAATLALEHALEQYCPLTVGALRLVGAWAVDLGDFAVRSRALGTAGDSAAWFVAEMAGHSHPLVASVAQFEAAMKKVREGHTEDHVIGWSYSPNLVLAALREGERLDMEAARGSFWTIVAPDLPGYYHVLAAGQSPGGESDRPGEERQEKRPVGVRY
jgi:hypothetical protein